MSALSYGAGTDADDLDLKARSTAIRQALAQGWTRDGNVQIDTCCAMAMPRNSQICRRIVALAPDVILAAGACGRAVAAGGPHRTDGVPDPSIRWAPASSTAWRGRAATPPASSCSNTA